MSQPRSVRPSPSRRDLLLGRTATTASSAPRHRPAMRRPEKSRALPPSKGTQPLPPLSVIALNRLAFGPRQGDLAAFDALGGDDLSRLTAYVDQQLDPTTIPDTAADARIAAAGFTTLAKTREQLWADHIVASPPYSERIRPLIETERVTWIRAVYGQRQLAEVLADFWHNHFNVYGNDFWVAPMFVHYDRDVIRGNMLGNFRQMVEDVAMSTSMLYYLDNYTSSDGGPNENFCRELFELHTLGAENYLGVLQQNQVPPGPGGFPLGYVDADVFEATRCFTGWTVSNSSSNPMIGNTGSFHYREDWHDRFQKNVLGVFIPQDQPPLTDGRDVLDALASHPGTGQHIAGKLCRRLIGDNPPQAVIDEAAAVFTAQVAAPDQLKQVVRTIVLHDAFRTTWGDKIKRPYEHVASALRAADADFPFVVEDSGNSDTFFWRYSHTGQELFRWRPPNGHPDTRDEWVSTTPRVMTWRLCNWLIDADEPDGVYHLDVLGQTPPGVRSAEALADFWIDRVLGRPMSAAERLEIVEFMAQGHNPTYDLPLDTDDDTQDRLRAMVGLIFMSPAFAWR